MGTRPLRRVSLAHPVRWVSPAHPGGGRRTGTVQPGNIDDDCDSASYIVTMVGDRIIAEHHTAVDD